MNRIVENYTGAQEWKRVYDDGWIEQGGKIETSFGSRGSYTFTFPVPFTATPLSFDTTVIYPKYGDQLGFELCVTNLTATSVTVMYDYPSNAGNIKGFYWRAKGV